MRIKNRYCAKLSPALLSALNERKIAYETFSMCNSPYIIFYLYDDDFDKEKIESCLNDINAIILPEMVFSKSEYENANWYCFIAKHDKISQCDNDQTYSFFCKKKDGRFDYFSTHKHQIGYYRLDKTPKWPKDLSVFSAEGRYDDIWFTNDTTRLFFENSGIAGLDFAPVINELSEMPLPNIHQLIFKNILPENALVLGIDNGIKSVVSCDSCGEKRYYVTRPYQLCLYDQYLGDQDIYVTQQIFGQGYGYRMVVGSKKLYHIVKESTLRKHFKVYPIRTES